MMRVTRLVLVLTLGLLVPLAGHADAEEIRQDALKGDRAAQYEMGVLYEFGFHLAEHETEALAWYSVAAERGSAPAAQRRALLEARLSAAQRARAEERRREIMTGMPAVVPPAPAADLPAESNPPSAEMPAPVPDAEPPVEPAPQP